MNDLRDILEAFIDLFTPPKRNPARFAPASAPDGWHQVPPAKVKAIRDPSTIYQIGGRMYGFTDRPFDAALEIEGELTQADLQELAARNLDPHNPYYAQAKRLFAANTGVTKSDLFEAIPSVSKHTLKDVLAAFRAAQRSPIGGGGGV